MKGNALKLKEMCDNLNGFLQQPRDFNKIRTHDILRSENLLRIFF